MSQFLQLSPQISKGLSKPIYKNAKKLQSDAMLLAEINKSYHTATSLLILSAEETIKAIFVLLHSHGYSVYKIRNARKFFGDHRMRHQLSKLIELIVGLLESFEKYSIAPKSLLIQTRNKKVDQFLNGLLDLVSASIPVLESTRRIREIDEFNLNKNRGFYVDYIEEIKIPSEIVDEKQFLQTKQITLRILRVYKSLNVLFHPKIEGHLDNQQVQFIKKQLSVLINEAIVDTSFDFSKL